MVIQDRSGTVSSWRPDYLFLTDCNDRKKCRIPVGVFFLTGFPDGCTDRSWSWPGKPKPLGRRQELFPDGRPSGIVCFSCRAVSAGCFHRNVGTFLSVFDRQKKPVAWYYYSRTSQLRVKRWMSFLHIYQYHPSLPCRTTYARRFSCQRSLSLLLWFAVDPYARVHREKQLGQPQHPRNLSRTRYTIPRRKYNSRSISCLNVEVEKRREERAEVTVRLQPV